MRLASLFRYALGVAAARGVPGRARQGRHARAWSSRTSPPRSPAPSRSSPARRRHQAPGQDRHRRHLPLATRRCCRCRWSRRCSPPARPATGSATDRCARSAALEPLVDEVLGYTRYRIEGASTAPATTTPPSWWSTAAGSAASCAAAPTTTPSCGAPSTGSPPSARCWWPRAAATAAPCVHRARGEGQRSATGLTLLHVRLRRRPAAAVAAGGAAGLPRTATAPLKDAVTETEPTFRDDLLVDVPVGRPDDRAGATTWPTTGAS